MASTAEKTKQVRRPNLSRYYGRRLPPIRPGEFEFDLSARRAGRSGWQPLDRGVESFEWTEDGQTLTGAVQLRQAPFRITRGDRIRCRVRWAGAWYEVWTMRVQSPTERTIDESGTTSPVALADDMAAVNSGRRRWLFRKTKRRTHGWFGHDALRVAARREGIKLGRIVKCKHRMNKIDVKGSFLDLAIAVYRNEREKTGRRFVLRMHEGRFEVVPYRRNRLLYVLSEQIRSVQVTEEPKVEKPATVIVGKGRVGKGSDAKKVRHTEYRRDMVRRFGYVEREKDFGRVDSLADLRAKCKRELAKQYRVEKRVTVSTPGIPFIRRGDGAQVVVGSEGLKGRNSYVFCTGARHQVQGESYTSDFDFTQVDPYLKDRERREKEAREKARRRKKARTRGDA